MGNKFYNADVPRIIKGLDRIAAALEKALKEKEGSDGGESEGEEGAGEQETRDVLQDGA